MIGRLWQFFTQIQYEYDDVLRLQRAQLVQRITQVLGFLTIMVSFFIAINDLGNSNAIQQSLLVLMAAIGITTLVTGLLQNGYESVAGLLLVTMLIGVSTPVLEGTLNTIDSATIITPVVIAALLLGWRETLLTWFITILVMVPILLNTTGAELQDAIIFVSVHTMVAFLVTYYIQRSQSVSRQFETDARRIRRISNLASTLNVSNDERQILQQVLMLIRNELGFAHATFYGVDTSGKFTRRVRGGMSLTEDEAVRLSAANAISEASRSRDVIIVSLVSDSTRRRHFEPGTTVAVAIPVQFEDDLLGVIDVQSNAASITRNEINTLRSLANLLYGTLKQARLVRGMEEDINEQQQIIVNQRDRLRELDERQQQLVTRVWNEYLQSRRSDAVGYDIDRQHNFSPAEDLPEHVRQGIEAGEVVVQKDDDYQIISVPIALREQVIGAMSFRLSAKRRANERQIELIQNVVRRLGLALENQRLVEQSQTQAQRESRANEIGSLLLGTTDIEDLLSVAADRFNQALGAIQTQIHLQPSALESALDEQTGETTP
jgi:GAF domain-containing protein